MSKISLWKKVTIAVLMVCVLVCCVTVGFTFSYFSDEISSTGTVSLGHLSLANLKSSGSDLNISIIDAIPGQTIFDKTITASVDSNIAYYDRLNISATITPEDGAVHSETCEDAREDAMDLLDISFSGANSFVKHTVNDATYFYDLAYHPGITSNSISFKMTIVLEEWVGDIDCYYYMGATINISLRLEAMQADYLESETVGSNFATVQDAHNKWSNISSTKIPLQYQQVEYIQSDGTQYIDTQFTPTNKTRVLVDADLTTGAGIEAILGSRRGDQQQFVIQRRATNGTFNIRWGNSQTTEFTSTGRVLIDFNNNVVSVNGNTHTFTNETFTGYGPICLFALNNTGEITNNSDAKIYKCIIWENGVLQQSFIPCYRKSDNVIGLYDTVNDVFYTNDGTGTFIKGANV